ncbi:hypothetical protein [Poriferisphaera corsica]|uniref:hypothetical protein n=1 Tax=Poriferisphaera corsica TaxID=2528020 RepID=UPI0011A7F3D5|nr:hypothetical protein [Poriferisphaera corsica]
MPTLLTVLVVVLNTFYGYFDDFHRILMLCIAICLMLSYSGGVIFFMFVAPVFASRDMFLAYPRTPKSIARSYSLAPCYLGYVSCFAGGFIVIFFILLLFYDAVYDGDWKIITVGFGLILCGLIYIAITTPIRRWLIKRFKRTIADRQLCFECGYDLRGNESALACPECGEKVLKADDV